MRWKKCFLPSNFGFWMVLLLAVWLTLNGNKPEPTANEGMNTLPKTRGGKCPQKVPPPDIAKPVAAKVDTITPLLRVQTALTDKPRDALSAGLLYRPLGVLCLPP